MALVGADAEFSNNVLIGARENAKKYNLKIVYDRSYPPALAASQISLCHHINSHRAI